MAIEYRPAPKPSGKTKMAPRQVPEKTLLKPAAIGKSTAPIVGDKSDPAVREKVVGALKSLIDKPAGKPSTKAASKSGEKIDKAAKKTAQPEAEKGKKLVSMRLDHDVLAAFRAMGKGWQGKINAALRQHLGL